jgi:hypothetical protein
VIILPGDHCDDGQNASARRAEVLSDLQILVGGGESPSARCMRGHQCAVLGRASCQGPREGYSASLTTRRVRVT